MFMSTPLCDGGGGYWYDTISVMGVEGVEVHSLTGPPLDNAIVANQCSDDSPSVCSERTSLSASCLSRECGGSGGAVYKLIYL